MDVALNGDLGLVPRPAGGPIFHAHPSKPSTSGHYQDQRPLRGGHYSKARAQSGRAVGSPGRGRNSLKHELGRVSHEEGGRGACEGMCVYSYVRAPLCIRVRGRARVHLCALVLRLFCYKPPAAQLALQACSDPLR